MALTFISEDSTPAYIALSSDIVDGMVDGISSSATIRFD